MSGQTTQGGGTNPRWRNEPKVRQNFADFLYLSKTAATNSDASIQRRSTFSRPNLIFPKPSAECERKILFPSAKDPLAVRSPVELIRDTENRTVPRHFGLPNLYGI